MLINPANIQITRLDEHLAHVDTVGHWITTQWPEESLREVCDMLLDDSNCPPTLIAMAEDQPVAVLAYKRHPSTESDTDELWINVLYVTPDWRKRGIGSQLVREGTSFAATHGPKPLFVFTDIPQFYERLGWQRHRFNKAKQMHVLKHSFHRSTIGNT
ncbi:MAG: GNAT family N-acetyltransferase [Verrucomicrobia subdivision 3 bacterium]|nr:GNAT family N-acetyltransferase [Limisphaerales bacterium]